MDPPEATPKLPAATRLHALSSPSLASAAADTATDDCPSWERHAEAWQDALRGPILALAAAAALAQALECLCSSHGECSLPPVHRGDRDSILQSACQPVCDALGLAYGGFGSPRHKAVFTGCGLLLLLLMRLSEALVLQPRRPDGVRARGPSGMLSAQQAYGATDSPLLRKVAEQRAEDAAWRNGRALFGPIGADEIYDLGHEATAAAHARLAASSTLLDACAALDVVAVFGGALAYLGWSMRVDAEDPGAYGWKPCCGAVLILFALRFLCGAATQLPPARGRLDSPLASPLAILAGEDAGRRPRMAFFSHTAGLCALVAFDAWRHDRIGAARAAAAILVAHAGFQLSTRGQRSIDVLAAVPVAFAVAKLSLWLYV
jgi:hypothetical protein